MPDKDSTTEVAAKKTSKNSKKWYKSSFVLGILGICLSLVVVSIVYSTAVILLGTEGETAPKIMIIPQAAFAATMVGIAFYKLFK